MRAVVRRRGGGPRGERQQREVPGRDETETGRWDARQGIAGALPSERVSCSWERLSQGCCGENKLIKVAIHEISSKSLNASRGDPSCGGQL